MRYKIVLLCCSLLPGLSMPALAQDGGPVDVGEGVTIDPMVAARLRYETVDQDNGLEAADALTLRIRAGAEVKSGFISFLAEGEGNAPVIDDFNDTLPGNGIEPFPVVADPGNFELNRLQIAAKKDGIGVTLGRQRIILDNARFVGNVGWRQNEQTFDAVRGEAAIGPVAIDAAYAVSQRTIFGVDSPSGHFDGDFGFLGAGVDLKGINAKGFAYLIDYDERIAFSSQTYGVLASGKLALPGGFALTAEASYAQQKDYGANPVDYSAAYLSAVLGATVSGIGLTAGYEELGSDEGVAAFQTPMATLHAFQGWADVFLTTPNAGVRDYYLGASKSVANVPLLGGINAAVTYHAFDADYGGAHYGSEWDASLGFKIGKVALLAKYANYRASTFGVDTEKFWLQAEFGF